MKLGINFLLWTTHVTEEHFPLFEGIKKIGYDGVQIPVFEGDEKHYKKIKQELDNQGLICTTSTCAGVDSDPSHPDQKIRDAALENLKWASDMNAVLDSKLMIGPFFAAHGQFDLFDGIDNARKRSSQVVDQAASYALQYDLQLSIEFLNRFEIYLLNCSEDAKKYLEMTSSENLGILYDTHHANIEERSITDAFESCGHKFNHLHFSESHRGILGDGCVDWQTTIQETNKIKDKIDWLVVEAFAHDVPGFSEVAHVWRPLFNDKMELCKKSFEFLKQKGF